MRNGPPCPLRRSYYANMAHPWQHAPMIISSGHLGVHVDIGDNKPVMKLQRRERGQDWKNYRKRHVNTGLA